MYINPIMPIAFVKKDPKNPKGGESSTSTSFARSKRCAKCGEKKDVNEYPKHSTSSDGRASYCRDCKNGLAKERRLRDPIARITHYTVTRIKNEWPKDKVPKDIQTNLEGYLGYKLFDLKKALRLDAQERYGKTLISCFKEGYHLDHIKPHSSFSPVDIGDEEFRKCWAIGNLRLIPSLENLQKGAKQDFYKEDDTIAIGGVDPDFDDEDEFDTAFDEEGEHIVDIIA